MMNKFNLKIITPEKTFYDGECVQLTVRTTEGNVGIMAGHINYTALLPAGPMRIKYEDGNSRDAAVSNGVVSVYDGKVTVLGNAVEWADEIDSERAKNAEQRARERLKAAQSAKEMDIASQKLKRALNRLSVSGKM